MQDLFKSIRELTDFMFPETHSTSWHKDRASFQATETEIPFEIFLRKEG